MVIVSAIKNKFYTKIGFPLKLLNKNTDLPIGQVAREVGYQQIAYFISRFSKREGLSPREYRQRYTLGQAKPNRYS